MSKSDQRYLWWEHTEAVKLALTLEMTGGKPGHEEDRMRSNDADWQQVDGLSQGQSGLEQSQPCHRSLG